MGRPFRYLILVLVGSATFGSCTCHRETPPVPQATGRPSGFSSTLPTQGKASSPNAAANSGPSPVGTSLTPLTTPSPRAVPTLQEVALPENFPTDLPVYKGAKPFAVQNLAGNARNVLFQVDAQAPEVFNFYQDQMRGQGWQESQQYQTKEQAFLSFKKGKMITNMTISKDPRTGRQVVAIMYQQEEDLPFPEF